MTQLPAESGTYVLMLRGRDCRMMQVGDLGRVSVRRGYYLYVGSAFGPGGIRARVSRHLRGASKPHWHIDYLRRHADPLAAWFEAGSIPHEHRWAATLGRVRGIDAAFPRFGASDCRCETHLFFAAAAPSLTAFRWRLRSKGLMAEIQEQWVA